MGMYSVGRTLGVRAWLACSLLMAVDGHAQVPKARSVRAYEPSVRLLTQNGKAVSFYEDVIKGRIALVNTMFTSCPSICPAMTGNLAKVQRGLAPHLGKQVIMVSISVDPEVDTPAVLKRYAERFGIGPGWLFLTGKRTDVDAVLAKIGDGDIDKNRHSGMLLVGDDAAWSWRKLFAMSNPAQIVAVVENMLAQRAATSRPASPAAATTPP